MSAFAFTPRLVRSTPAALKARSGNGPAPGGGRRHLGASRTAACALLVCLAATACADPSGPGRVRSRVAFDVSGITGAAASLGNGASVVARADLVITPENDDENVRLFRQLPLTSTDSIAEFDIELEAGNYTMWGYIFSNSDALLYEGNVTVNIDDDDFLVEISPNATNAVMIVSPRASTRPPSFEVRNVGSQTLVWNVACIRTPPTSTCLDPRQFPFALQNGTVAPGATTVLPIGSTTGFAPGSYRIEFDSNVGSVAIDMTW